MDEMLSELARIPQVGSCMDLLSVDCMHFIDDRTSGGRDVFEKSSRGRSVMMRVIDSRVHGWDKTMVVRGNLTVRLASYLSQAMGLLLTDALRGDGIHHHSFCVLS